MRLFLSVTMALFLPTVKLSAQTSPPDFKLKATLVARFLKEHLLALRADSMGRLFVGAREGLFVCDPKKNGGFEPHTVLARFPASSSISDIEVRGDDVYVLTQNALYLIEGGVKKRAGLVPRKLIWGVPSSGNADGFRSLTWGPEGDLYLSLAAPCQRDRLAYWTFFTQPEGAKVPYRGVGGVFRCRPDGSDLRIVAHGLRHPATLAFDRHWNLFTREDIDKTSQLWHVTPHARLGPGICKFDTLPPLRADVDRAGPWYFDDAALPNGLRRQLVLGINRRCVSHTPMARGASFELIKPFTFEGDSPEVLTVAAGRVLAIIERDAIHELTFGDDRQAAFEPYQTANASVERLWQELGASSWHRRQGAHLEILRRGDDLLKEVSQRLNKSIANDPAYPHLIWLTARTGKGSLHLLTLIDHPEPTIRALVLRALAEYPEQVADEPIFARGLVDEDAHVRHAALLAYFAPKVAWTGPAQFAIERGPARDEDARLRQTAALLLAKKATVKEIESMCGRVDATWRMAGVLAAGYRLTLPAVHEPLAQHLPLEDAARVIEYADGKVNLGERGRVGTFTIGQHWNADKHTVEQELLFKLLRKTLKDGDESVRVQSARFLAVLEDARCADEVRSVLQK